MAMEFLMVLFLGLQEDELERKLRSDRIEERADAERVVQKAGRKAKGLLEQLARDEDAEVRERAQSILTAMGPAWGLDTLEAIQRALEGAKTLRVQLKDEGTPGGVRCSGLLLLEGAHRASLRVEADIPGGLKGTCVFVSNGTTMTFRLSTANPTGELRAEGRAPAQLNRTLIRALVRAGPLFPLRAIQPTGGLVVSRETLLDVSPAEVTLTKVAWKPSLSYTLPEAGQSPILGRIVSSPANVTWEADPETFAPRHRKFRLRLRQGWDQVEVDVREDYAFDVDLPPSTFVTVLPVGSR